MSRKTVKLSMENGKSGNNKGSFFPPNIHYICCLFSHEVFNLFKTQFLKKKFFWVGGRGLVEL